MNIHVAGIGGVGMSAVAEALLDAGAAVSGSDRAWDADGESVVIQKLIRRGLRIFPQDGSAITGDTAALVVSTAIEDSNPEVQRAKMRGIPIKHRSEMLAGIFKGKPLIAVAGTCGKSTTTAILGVILEECGRDPMVVNGAAVVNWVTDERIGNVRKNATTPPFGHPSAGGELETTPALSRHPSAGGEFNAPFPSCGGVPEGRGGFPSPLSFSLAELDESDRSLLTFTPTHAILTNASADHFPLDETLALFRQFKERIASDGILIDNIWGGTPMPPIEKIAWGNAWVWEGQRYEIHLPGAHNAVNAWLAVRMALALGLEAGSIAKALQKFKGVERRLERVGTRADGVMVIDDYAHNTEKLRATWTTLAEHSQRVLGLWRPHGYGPLRAMMDALTTMFAETLRPQDIVYLLPVYDAGGTADRSVTSHDLATRLRERGIAVVEVATHNDAIALLRKEAKEGDILATLGARDPALPQTAAQLR